MYDVIKQGRYAVKVLKLKSKTRNGARGVLEKQQRHEGEDGLEVCYVYCCT